MSQAYAILTFNEEGKAKIKEMEAFDTFSEEEIRESEEIIVEMLTNSLEEQQFKNALVFVSFRMIYEKGGTFEHTEYELNIEMQDYFVLHQDYKKLYQQNVSHIVTHQGHRNTLLHPQDEEEKYWANNLVGEWEEFYDEDFEILSDYQNHTGTYYIVLEVSPNRKVRTKTIIALNDSEQESIESNLSFIEHDIIEQLSPEAKDCVLFVAFTLQWDDNSQPFSAAFEMKTNILSQNPIITNYKEAMQQEVTGLITVFGMTDPFAEDIDTETKENNDALIQEWETFFEDTFSLWKPKVIGSIKDLPF